MSTITVRDGKHVDSDDDAPLLAHWSDIAEPGPPRGLCGKPLMGVPAPETAPVCVVCHEMHEAWLRELSGR